MLFAAAIAAAAISTAAPAAFATCTVAAANAAFGYAAVCTFLHLLQVLNSSLRFSVLFCGGAAGESGAGDGSCSLCTRRMCFTSAARLCIKRPHPCQGQTWSC